MLKRDISDEDRERSREILLVVEEAVARQEMSFAGNADGNSGAGEMDSIALEIRMRLGTVGKLTGRDIVDIFLCRGLGIVLGTDYGS